MFYQVKFKLILGLCLDKPSTSQSDSHVTAETSLTCTIYDFMKNFISCLVTQAVELSQNNRKKIFTKKGTIRKRKCYETSVADRKKRKLEQEILNHSVKELCNVNTCALKCTTTIGIERQNDINKQYWSLDKTTRQQFVFNCVKGQMKKRSTVEHHNSRRNNTFQYFLKNADGEDVRVCKVFLLAVLGYEKSNDRFLKNIRKNDKRVITPKQDARGHKLPKNAIPKQPIVSHIMSFKPTIAHYRREHAPKRLYLPSDVSIQAMYEDYKATHPNNQCSYETYRQEIVKLNIGFAQLGNEECFQCESFKLHATEANHKDSKLFPECDTCVKYSDHRNRFTAARKKYDEDAVKPENNSDLYVSADLQKVIMLPRAEMFKEVIFVRRITVFNESFVPLGTKQHYKPLGVLWHEGIASRKKEQIISTFYAFFLQTRDRDNITIWLDNCGGQNKNWALFCFFVYIVNSDDVVLNSLTINYFERGHSFMSADSFHHMVEKEMKKAKTVWDFDDFVACVKQCNRGKCQALPISVEHFFHWKDYSSKAKLKKAKVYLKDIVTVKFSRGATTFKYKTQHDPTADHFEVDFLLPKKIKNCLQLPDKQQSLNGFDRNRKETIIKTLGPIMPPTRLKFWKELQVNTESENENFESGSDSE